MTDNSEAPIDPEMTFYPVHGDCGHIYTVPLARLEDGKEFTCPVCGQADHFDADAINAAREELDKLAEEAPLEGTRKAIREMLDRSSALKN